MGNINLQDKNSVKETSERILAKMEIAIDQFFSTHELCGMHGGLQVALANDYSEDNERLQSTLLTLIQNELIATE